MNHDAWPPQVEFGYSPTYLRVIARAVTKVLNTYLARLGVEARQTDVLCLLMDDRRLRVIDMAALLALNETTLIRRLRVLEARRWVRIEIGVDKRERFVSLTAAGRAVVSRALPLLNRAQLEVDDVIRGQMTEVTRRLTEASRSG